MTRERKVIIGIGVLVLILGAVYRYAPDVQTFFVPEEVIALKMKKLQQQNQVIARQALYQARSSGTAALLTAAEKGLLEGSTPSLAAVGMQNTIKAVVYRAGLEVSTFQVLKAQDPHETGYAGIPVKFQILSDVRQLKDVIYGIETAEKLFRITEINSRINGRYKPGVPVLVRSIITVEGYVTGG